MAIRTYSSLFHKLDSAVGDSLTRIGYHSGAIIKKFIEEYYHEYDPVRYRRTFQFLESVVTTKAVKDGNKWYVDIFVDYENLHYKEATGLQVIEWANNGSHGGWIESPYFTHFWDNSMMDLCGKDNGVIVQDFIIFLKQMTGCKIEKR